MKTILHVIDTTGPGGAETIFTDLATRLPNDSYRCLVSIRGKGWLYEELGRRGVEPVILDAKGSFNWQYLLRLVGLIRREKVDLIQSHLLGSNVYCSLAGLITRRPVVATFHGTVDIDNVEKLGNLKFGLINAGASCIVAVSDSLRRDIADKTSLSKNKTELIYNGIETADYRHPHSNALRQKFGWAEDEIIVGSLGNIRPAKGYDILLRAAALLGQGSHSYRFVIAGQCNTRLYDELIQIRHDLGLEERVLFLGFIDDAADFLSNLDMFLSTSISEGLPLSAIQAMVAALPIIATRCGGYQELLTEGENGWLVDVGDPQAIADAIEKVSDSRGLGEKLGKQARKHAIETFDMAVMLDNYTSVYERCMKGR
jgi:glycosyltransferase involved in cell wall biosynthesis